MSKLLIVESPSKNKTIREILGPGWQVAATLGHIRALKEDLEALGFDPSSDAPEWNPTYEAIASKRAAISALRKAAAAASEIYLASDNDREGEAIAFHTAAILGLNPATTPRLRFIAITESALKEAIAHPSRIDMNKFEAQQARSMLDLLIGYTLSPCLWRSVGFQKGLSAGRCQSPALRLVYDNDKEIKSAEEKKVYNVSGYFTNSNLCFELTPQGKYETEDSVTEFLDGSADFSHIYTCSQPVKVFRKPPEPFTTSRIQQVASNELHYAPKETMRICQLLYEGGYITYMRTDSKTYSAEFIEDVKTYITRTYADGEKYIGDHIDSMIAGAVKEEPAVKKKGKKAADKAKVSVKDSLRQVKDSLRQEAHEAIRPTNISLYELPETMDSKEKRMYKLIWENTLESCMAPASLYSITANISAFQDNKFAYTTEIIDFPGWKIVAKKYPTATTVLPDVGSTYRWL